MNLAEYQRKLDEEAAQEAALEYEVDTIMETLEAEARIFDNDGTELSLNYFYAWASEYAHDDITGKNWRSQEQDLKRKWIKAVLDEDGQWTRDLVANG